MRCLPIALFAAIAILLAVPAVSADVAPPPMRFWVTYNQSDIQFDVGITSGWLYQCNDSGCATVAGDPMNVTCETWNPCETYYHPYTDYQKLALRFSDGTVRESGVFNFTYPGSYDVFVNDNGGIAVARRQVMDENNSYLNVLMIAFYAIFAMAITIAAELLIAGAYVCIAKKPWWVMIAVVAANIVSVPLVWIVSIVLTDQWPMVIIAMEAFAIVFEAFLIHLLNKKRMPLKDAFILSAAMNLGSIAVGWLAFVAML